MAVRLDILALEPFYGGMRRAMLETLMAGSRHRWTLLKLPPRRIERRLTTAAQWFAEQLSRHWVGRVDMLFTSEAMNLPDLFRLVPTLGRRPSVVYFHNNQLPLAGSEARRAHDLVNLTTAGAADEIWFNSLFHLKQFFTRASALIERHPEMSGFNPLPEIAGKSHVMAPPMDLATIAGEREARGAGKELGIFVETRDADLLLLNGAVKRLHHGGHKVRLTTVGPVKGLSELLPRTTLPEHDTAAHFQTLRGCDMFLSVRPQATHDHYAVHALAGGCRPLLPASGVYPELVPSALRLAWLYEPSADGLVDRLESALDVGGATPHDPELPNILGQFNPAAACVAIDQRLEEIAVIHSIRRPPS